MLARVAGFEGVSEVPHWLHFHVPQTPGPLHPECTAAQSLEQPKTRGAHGLLERRWGRPWVSGLFHPGMELVLWANNPGRPWPRSVPKQADHFLAAPGSAESTKDNGCSPCLVGTQGPIL